MHYLIGSQLGLVDVPFIFLVGVAYAWVADRVLTPRAIVRSGQKTHGIPRAA